MDTVATECRARKHHPEWTNVYNRTHVRWTTHNPEGLSSKDVGMARFCDEVASGKGEVLMAPGENQGPLSTADARECCSGKK
jgi:4a-hydroxytetrahydrobiopterin dehydratase